MSEIEQGKTITRIIFNHIAFEKHRAALTDKMGEYANRFNDDPTNNSAFIKYAIAEAVLQTVSPLSSIQLSQSIREKCTHAGVNFDIEKFNNACVVIAVYAGQSKAQLT